MAQLGGWRSVFFAAAGLMLVLACALYKGLPAYQTSVGISYPALIKSVVTLFREEPVLRLRAAYGGLAFAQFSVMWTPMAFLLSGPPFHYAPGTIGMFGLAGIAGALAASVGGRFADRGKANLVTGVTGVLLMASWLPLWLGAHSVALLLMGILLLDLSVQGLHIANQSQIYRLRPDARSRMTAAYMATFFGGGVIGSSLSSFTYAHAGWTGVCLLGSAFGAIAAGVWLFTLLTGTGRGVPERAA
jgi:predicted MFS family arabinose efflux permease